MSGALRRLVIVALVAFPRLIFAQEPGGNTISGDALELSGARLDSLFMPWSAAPMTQNVIAPADEMELPASAMDNMVSAEPAPKIQTQAGVAAPAHVQPAMNEPFFAKSLKVLGVDPVLVSRLTETSAAETRSGNNNAAPAPEPTPNLVAAMVLLGPTGQNLSKREKIALITAALVAAQPQLPQDHQTLFSELEAQTGITPSEIATLCSAAGFGTKNSPPAAVDMPLEQQAWISRWSHHLGFAAKVAGAAQMALQPKSLAEALRAKITLNALRASPEFMIFPTMVRNQIQSIVNQSRDRRQGSPQMPVNEAARAQAPPNAFGSRALADARAQTKALGFASKAIETGATVENPLVALKNNSFVVLPMKDVPNSFLESRIMKRINQLTAERSLSPWALFDPAQGARWEDTRLIPKLPLDLITDVRTFVEGLTRALQTALPEEGIELKDASIRISRQLNVDTHPHIDFRGYITITCTLQGPGTIIYDDSQSGRPRVIQAPVGAAVFVSNADRALARNIPGAIHAAPSAWGATPPVQDPYRVVLVIRHKIRAEPAVSKSQRELIQKRNDQRIDAVEAQLARPK